MRVLVDLHEHGQAARRRRVVQMPLSIRDCVSSDDAATVKELKGFQKYRSSPAQTQVRGLEIAPELLAFYDISMKISLVEPGEFEIEGLAVPRATKDLPAGDV